MELSMMLQKTLSFDFTVLPIFDGLTVEEINSVISDFHGFIKSYPKGDYVYLAGDLIENVCVIMAGSVQMVKEDVAGGRTIIANLLQGEVFAGTTLGMKNKRSLASYIVSSDSEILLLPLFKILHDSDSELPYQLRLMRNVVSILADINTKLIKKTEILSCKTLREKIMSYLQAEADEQKTEEFSILFNRTDLANYLDADRSSLTRELSRMRDDGLLEYNKNNFRLLKEMIK